MMKAVCFREVDVEAEEVPIDSLRAHADEPGCLLWIDCADPTPDDLALLAKQLHLHELTVEDLKKGRQRTKLERYPNYFHVALHACSLIEDELVMQEFDVVFDEGWLLSVHPNSGPAPTMSVEQARRRYERQRDELGADDEGFLLWAIVDVIVDGYFEVSTAIDDRLDLVEDVVFDEKETRLQREIFTLRRSMAEFRRAVGPLREVLGQILRKEVHCIGAEALVHVQDVYDHVLRVLDLIESQREVLTGLREGQLAVRANQMSRVMKATSSWGAILIASTLVAGIYGMNFEHMPELGWQLGYPFALGIMGLVTVTLYRVFKRHDWL
jgi:magnesium transporter